MFYYYVRVYSQMMYFSVDSDAYEGFLRGLSVVSDKFIVSSDPSEDVPIYLDALYEVLHHGEGYGGGDSHRFALPPEQDKSLPVVRSSLKAVESANNCC